MNAYQNDKLHLCAPRPDLVRAAMSAMVRETGCTPNVNIREMAISAGVMLTKIRANPGMLRYGMTATQTVIYNLKELFAAHAARGVVFKTPAIHPAHPSQWKGF
ncbi:unknown [Singapore grouper iridovirus]|uniref:Uncharacterized protein n=1 Tax=Singapore grouper iridovirus TaxID=262968 RepID=Q5YFC6_9VIRU|nr:hypothetical protein ORF139R [Singapore grouper iridovirus]AAS18154.1 unknown [Singapore grouper iridovirus]WAU86848.1 hypothetical protein ORF139R [Singapore grouper iridovirus]8HIF_y6 Chain y6, VP139 [Singapore grouper iridovirus]